jgi:membrane protein
MMAKIRATLRAAALLKHPVREIARHPGEFTLRVLKAFKANQGILLAGAVAYYTLLSLIPFLLLLMLVLSRIVDRTMLFSTLTEYLEFLAPGAGVALVDNLRAVLDSGSLVGVVVTITMLLTSALAFAVLENAMSVIFFHRVKIRRRRFLFSAMLPYSFMLSLSVGLFVMTIVSGKLAALAEQHALLSNYLLYLVGVAGEVLVLTAIYHVMPVGRMSWRHAFLGGATATVLWEITRHILRWYFGSISHIQEVYGSFTTTIAVLLSVEFAAILLLLGAQVIAEYERLLLEPPDAAPKPMRTGS